MSLAYRWRRWSGEGALIISILVALLLVGVVHVQWIMILVLVHMLIVPKPVGICRVVKGGGLVWIMLENLLMVRGHDVLLVVVIKWVGETLVGWKGWRR